MARIEKSEYFLALAKLASMRSTCVRRKVGCVLTDSKAHIIGIGYNGVAAGERHCSDTQCPGANHKSGEGLDHCEAIHAEQNAILQCRDPQKISVAYVTTAPCVSCTKLLLNTSCNFIVFLEDYPNSGLNIWNRSWTQHGPINNVFTQIIMESTKRIT